MIQFSKPAGGYFINKVIDELEIIRNGLKKSKTLLEAESIISHVLAE